jgi:cAMP-binding proteins - catabolite gene activator and regulatory subunit of cAMP-dependent protein kinases
MNEFNVSIKEVISSFPEQIRKQFLPVTFRPRDVVISEGEKVEYGYIFTEGIFDVSKNDVHGNRYIIQKNHTGPLCCFMDIYSTRFVQCSTITAVSTLTGYRIPRECCMEMLRTPSLFQTYIIRLWALQFYNSNVNTAHYPMYSFRYKFIDFLLKSSVEKDGKQRMSMKRDDIANTLGCSRRTLFRLLKSLADEGLIQSEGNALTMTGSQYEKLKTELEDWV